MDVVTSQVHDLAIMRDGQGRDGRLHHTAYYLDTPEGILRAADIFVDEGTPIDTGPGKHGLTQAFFIYVFEPGGNRVELFSGGYVIHGPDTTHPKRPRRTIPRHARPSASGGPCRPRTRRVAIRERSCETAASGGSPREMAPGKRI